MSESVANHLPHLGFRIYQPSVFLRRYVDCYWFIYATNQSGTVYDEFFHPDGGMGIIYNFGDPLGFGGKVELGDSFLDGTNTKSIRLGLGGKINSIGIRFKPGGAYAFMSVPLNELKNSRNLCSEIQLYSLSDLHEQLAEITTDTEKVKVLNQTLLKILNTNKQITGLVSCSITAIKSNHGSVPVAELAKNLQANPRKLERAFNAQVGMTPLEYSKAIRIKRARACLKQESFTYVDIAYDLGFYDQAHFIKQFKSLVGVTPGAYRQRATEKMNAADCRHRTNH